MDGACYVNSSKGPLKCHTSSQASTMLIGNLLSPLQEVESPSNVSASSIHPSGISLLFFSLILFLSFPLLFLLLCGSRYGTQGLTLTRQTLPWN